VDDIAMVGDCLQTLIADQLGVLAAAVNVLSFSVLTSAAVAVGPRRFFRASP
jgi:hypothetical protein